MRFLIDESLSQRLASRLSTAGHDVAHVADLDMFGASDDAVLVAAADQARILVTADTDFGTLLALSGQEAPSVILMRHPARHHHEQADLLLANASTFNASENTGFIAVVDAHRIRLRPLPIGPPPQ